MTASIQSVRVDRLGLDLGERPDRDVDGHRRRPDLLRPSSKPGRHRIDPTVVEVADTGRFVLLLTLTGFSPGARSGPADLLHMADAALYEAKRSGRGRFETYRSGTAAGARPFD